MFKRLAAQIILPFAVISVLTTLLVGYVCFSRMNDNLLSSLEDRSKILTLSLANELTDPFAYGEYDRIDQILEKAGKADSDLQYAIVLSSDGRAIATTDPSLKNHLLTQNDFQKEALRVTELRARPFPFDKRYFEMAIPITTNNGQTGYLRVGFSKEQVEQKVQEAEILIWGLGLGALLVGVTIYWGLTNRSILKPIAGVVNAANRISSGDLPDTLDVDRKDEIGQLVTSMNAMVKDLRVMATVANSIASGDLSVQVEPKSSADVFGNAFKKMIQSLNEHTQELAAREERFRTLCQTSPVGIFETDPQGATTYANACWEQMSGQLLDEMKGNPWYKTVHEQDQTKIIERWEQIATSKDTSIGYSQELRIVRPSGEVSWGHCLATKLMSEGQTKGFVCTIEDITKRKVSDMAQYEITAILSETKSVEEAAPKILELACHTLDLEAAILWKVDEADGVLRMSHAWFAPTDAGRNMEDAAQDYAIMKSDGLGGLVWTLGRPMWLDREHLKRNVSSKFGLLDANPHVRSAFGCPVQVRHKTIGVMEFYSRASNELNMDLLESYSSVAMQLGQFTERLEAEMSAKQLAAVVESSDDAIMSATLGSKVISWNKGAQKLFGYSPQETIGRSIELLLLQENKDQFLELIGDILSDIPVEGFETVLAKKDGSVVDVALTISPVQAESDRIVGISVIARDITHKKAVEDRMREFYAIVSHELRTPLTSIRGALGLISDGVIAAESEEGIELINLAKSSVIRLVRLINDILDLRKIEGGNLELDLQDIDSADLVSKSVDAMRGLAQERAVSIVTDVRAKGHVLADSDRAVQVLTNLISNAIKYSNPDGEVLVMVAPGESPSRLRISVTDKGQGIPKDLQHKLFGKFQQIDSSDTRAKEGTGLGLAISKAIVEQHGGTIGVNSTVGVGSTFWFELRLSTEEAMHAVEPDAGPCILTIEDDRELCAVLKVFLNREGYRCEFAHTLADAFEKLKTLRPDLVLLDVGLPDGSGLDVIEKLRNDPEPTLAGVPVIVITASERNKREQYAATIVDWLPKPFEYETLRRAMVSAGVATEGKKVLVVEDDDYTRQIIMQELAELGVNSIAAKDGVEAIEKVSKDPPDLIILDVAMPRADGFEVISRLRGKTHPPPPVLIYSGRELAKQEKDQLRLGLTRYLTKGSVPREEFLTYVKQMLAFALTEDKVGAGGGSTDGTG